MLKKTANLFATAYLLIIFFVYPFYLQDGYVDIGEAKNHFFLYVSFAAFGIFGILGMLYFFVRLRDILMQKRAYLIDWDNVSITDLFVMLYATMVFLSYVLTDYREEALWGTEGWYIGCVLLLLLCGLYFFISRMWNGNKRMFYVIAAASGFVFLFGICSRFSFYPASFEVVQPEFISTLGNINWFCGYLSVVSPVGIGMFLLSDEGQSGRFGKTGLLRKRFWLFAYVLVTFMSAFSQGSNSVFLWFMALFLMFLWICLEKESWLKNFMLLVILWGISAQIIRLMRYLFPERYNYDADNLCGYFTGSSFTLWIMLLGIAGCALTAVMEKNKKTVRKILLISVSLCAGAWLLISVINTRWGISVLQENVIFQQIFLLDENWGNGRGAAFHAAVWIFKELPPIHKLFGAGPDCFSMYAYSIPELALMLHESFGSARLTNAHNELLTGLVNTGILGILSYLGILLSFIGRCMKKGREKPVLFIPAVCAAGYFIHNMVSFAQVLNLPFLFLLLGMGAAIERA